MPVDKDKLKICNSGLLKDSTLSLIRPGPMLSGPGDFDLLSCLTNWFISSRFTGATNILCLTGVSR